MPREPGYRFGIKDIKIQGQMMIIKKFDLITEGSYEKFYDIILDIEKERKLTGCNMAFVVSMIESIGKERILGGGMYKILKNFLNTHNIMI